MRLFARSRVDVFPSSFALKCNIRSATQANLGSPPPPLAVSGDSYLGHCSPSQCEASQIWTAKTSGPEGQS
jgi:hypothetical protein